MHTKVYLKTGNMHTMFGGAGLMKDDGSVLACQNIIEHMTLCGKNTDEVVFT